MPRILFSRLVRRSLWLTVALSGCLPELAAECSVDDDCPAERPICISEVCTPTVAGSDGGAPDGPRPADAEVAPGDAESVDAEPVDAERLDGCLPEPEICNGLDDDCDGETDEVSAGVPLSRPCFSGTADQASVGVCRSGRSTCEGGAYGRCEGEVAPRLEVCPVDDRDCGGLCNGLDDDCDGRTDEGLAAACGPDTDIGRCQVGARRCEDGFWLRCEGDVGPAAFDICDGQDNDCDRWVDEDGGDCACVEGEVQTCYSGPDGTLEVGVCADGIQVCEEGGPGPCEDEILPGAEVCDSVDNDCDGAVDEDFESQQCTVGDGACSRTGRTECPDGALLERCDVEPGPAGPEVCNAVDDDCDGRTDEGFPVGEECDAGLGRCRTTGAWVCQDGVAVCDAVAGAPRGERCNGLDDDCDEAVDEGIGGAPLTRPCYDGPAGTRGEGICVEGTSTCAGGIWGRCEGAGRPLGERCNQVDDDCDGVVDDVEGGCACTVGQPQACYGGPAGTAGVGPCLMGEQTCEEVDGVARPGPCVGEVLPGDELCNGVDDDCDGDVDEGDFGPCSDGLGACRREGVYQCQDSARVCDAQAGPPMDEVCNGVDDDCDGTADDIPREPCTVGDGVCVNSGEWRCEGMARVCDAAPTPGGDEVCNGLDDDCDAAVDEGLGGMACDAGVGICAGPGTMQCAAGAMVCAPDEPVTPADEACNGLDDDCDGASDEQPQDLCPARPNASPACAAGACDLNCVAGFYDADDDEGTGCERGCGAVVEGERIDTTGAPLAVAARPDVDEFAIAWLDANGTPFMAIEGGDPFPIDRVEPNDEGLIGSDIRLVGVTGGYSALLSLNRGAIAIDVPVADGGPGALSIWPADRLLAQPDALYRSFDAEAQSDVLVTLGYAPAAGGAGVDPALRRLSRPFGGAFTAEVEVIGVPGATWQQGSVSGLEVDGRAVIVGATLRGPQLHLRIRWDDGGLLSADLGGDSPVQTAVAARDGRVVVGATGGFGSSLFAFDAVDGNPGNPETRPEQGEIGGVVFGASGPVATGLVAGAPLGFVVGADPIEVFGAHPLVVGNASAVDVALTTGERHVLVWRDPLGGIRWAEHPCR